MKLLKTLVIACFFIVGCKNTTNSGKDVLRIATSANMQFAMKELIEGYREETGAAIEMIVGSSGKLTAQILHGAPYDLFISADMRYPKKLMQAGLIIDEPSVYAFGKLVLLTNKAALKPTVESLTSDKVRHIALANPETAPYGNASIEAIRNMGLLDTLRSKFVFGESISQTNQFVSSGSAQIGFTSMSSVLSTDLSESIEWSSIDGRYYETIYQGAVILKNSKTPFAAQSFLSYILGKAGREVLSKYGYDLPKDARTL